MKREYYIAVGVLILIVITSLTYTNPDYSIENESEELVSESKVDSQVIYVQVSGAVAKPGLYKMESDDRVNDLLLEADVLDYNLECINLAQKLVDELNFYVPSKDEQCPNLEAINSNGVVNINSASSYELQTLSGIGEAKADSIVEYRNQNGSFQEINDLTNVEGISDNLLASISPQISLS